MSFVSELEDRFTDQDEINMICIHGMEGGVSDFIWSSELYNWFVQYEEEIEDILDSYGIQPSDLVDDVSYWSFQELREKAVWRAVSLWCMAHNDDV